MGSASEAAFLRRSPRAQSFEVRCSVTLHRLHPTFLRCCHVPGLGTGHQSREETHSTLRIMRLFLMSRAQMTNTDLPAICTKQKGGFGEPLWLEEGSQGTGWSSFFLDCTIINKAKISKDALIHVHKIEKISVFHITYLGALKNVFLILLCGEVGEL